MATKADEPVKGELVQYGSAIEELTAYIQGLEPEDEVDVQDRIVRNILNAASPTALADAGSAVKSEDLLNVHLRAHSLHPAGSSFDGGTGWYLHVDVETVANGDRMTMSVGANDVVVKLVQAARRGWLPFEFKMERAKQPTKNGYYPIFMRSAQAANGRGDGGHPGQANVSHSPDEAPF